MMCCEIRKKTVSPNRIVAPRRREEIIQATIRCLARDGHAKFTMKTLAQEAGLKQSILHYYFDDKAAILAAALQTVTSSLDQRITQAQDAAPPTPDERLRAVIRACLQTVQECPELWRVYIQLWGEMMHNDALLAINAELYDKVRRRMAALLNLGIRSGTFRRLDVIQAATVIVGLIDGIALQLTLDPNTLNLDQAVQCGCEAAEAYLRP